MKQYLIDHWNLIIPHMDKKINAIVPGSIYHDLLLNDLIPDPYDQTNEYEVREWMRNEFIYENTFYIDNTNCDIYLVCEGIDTLSVIFINGKEIARTNNMHIRYRFNIKSYLNKGENSLKIKILSSIKYIEHKRENAKHRFFQVRDAMKGYPYIRKAHAMFGWDWGPQLPDAGIWRDIYIERTNEGYISDIQIKQQHEKEQVMVSYELEGDLKKDQKFEVRLYDPNHHLIYKSNESKDKIIIKEPQLWWPIGLGTPNLYYLVVSLNDHVYMTKKIGLKVSQLKRQKDQFGTSFTYVHNGVEIFLKGANYIIEDSIFGRYSKKRTKELLETAIKANHNAIRVWGGGIYPSDDFYDLCDELGLIVWQDFMFACSFYDMDDLAFVENVKMEIIDNLKRLNHHPSLSILCGNNENETAAVHWFIPSLKVSKRMYIELYEKIMPALIHDFKIDVPYWPSSPSSGGKFKDPNADHSGDMHYWEVWHGNKPIENYRTIFPRFMSEFGIQSFPSIDTVRTYAREKDYNIYSTVMKSHQKNRTANKKIMAYLKKMFNYPNSFENILYVSQLIQAEGVRYGVEHFRRNYGRTMGSLYWQLNDCWPVASWSSIDYYGRWKALHYHAKKFYQPILISIEENKQTMEANIVITNDERKDYKFTYTYQLIDVDGHILAEQERFIMVNRQSAQIIDKLNFKHFKDMKKRIILYVSLKQEQQVISDNIATFVQDKNLELESSKINMDIKKLDDTVWINLKTNTLQRFVMLGYKDYVFSDNYFHLIPNKKKTIILTTHDSIEEIEQQLKIKSLIDTY